VPVQKFIATKNINHHSESDARRSLTNEEIKKISGVKNTHTQPGKKKSL
jgi:hypothetical protein